MSGEGEVAAAARSRLRRLRARLRVLEPRSWSRAVVRAAMLAAIVAALAFGFIGLGLTPIAASDGHWPLTYRLLQFAMERSVRSSSLRLRPPDDLDDPGLVALGAAHYASYCVACHAAPGRPASPIVAYMLPAPPPLQSQVRDWRDEEMFWIVRHGLKYTAMPAWTAQSREDEVWAVVAFLRRLPWLDAARFDALAEGEGKNRPRGTAGRPASADRVGHTQRTLADCARCHGVDGRGRGERVAPMLAGQQREYLLASLEAFRRGTRASGFMQPVAAELDTESARELAEHYASLSATSPSVIGAAPQRGRVLALEGDRARRIPPCAECHGPGERRRNAHFPRIEGQYATYLEQQLRLFRDRKRGGTRYAPLMERAASGLTDEDIVDVAGFYAQSARAP